MAWTVGSNPILRNRAGSQALQIILNVVGLRVVTHDGYPVAGYQGNGAYNWARRPEGGLRSADLEACDADKHPTYSHA